MARPSLIRFPTDSCGTNPARLRCPAIPPKKNGRRTTDGCSNPASTKGYLISEPLGNITRVQHVRDFLRGLQGDPGPKFPILLKKVVYDGTHTGDFIPVKAIAGSVAGSGPGARLQRYSDRGRKRILPQHEAPVRSQHRNREPDHVLSHGSSMHGLRTRSTVKRIPNRSRDIRCDSSMLVWY